MTNSDGQHQPLLQRLVKDGQQAFGTQLSLDGNMTEESKSLLTASREWGRQIGSGKEEKAYWIGSFDMNNFKETNIFSGSDYFLTKACHQILSLVLMVALLDIVFV